MKSQNSFSLVILALFLLLQCANGGVIVEHPQIVGDTCSGCNENCKQLGSTGSCDDSGNCICHFPPIRATNAKGHMIVEHDVSNLELQPQIVGDTCSGCNENCKQLGGTGSCDDSGNCICHFPPIRASKFPPYFDIHIRNP